MTARPETLERRAVEAVEAAGGLWTRQRIAQALGVSRQAVADRQARGTLPPPAFTAGRSGSGDVPVWLGVQLPPDVPRR